jgi:hypothetical protein
MFKYSLDEFIAGKQREQADELFDELTNHSDLRYSESIEKLFDKVTYDYLEDFVRLVERDRRERIIIAAVPRTSIAYAAERDLKRGYDKLEKPWTDPIPYIEHSFPEEYKKSVRMAMNLCIAIFSSSLNITIYRVVKIV